MVTPRKPPRPAPPCGTLEGYRYHRRNDEQACAPCKAANAERVRNEREVAKPRVLTGKPGPKPSTSCPSLGQWERHRLAGERCAVCSAYRSGYDAATFRDAQLIRGLRHDVLALRSRLGLGTLRRSA